jgi:hypothetical protein
MPVSPIRLVLRCALFVLVLYLTGCYSASKESLPGRYTVKFDWGESTLELRKDGTLIEEATVKGGRKRRVEGKWSFKDRDISREPCLKMDHTGLDDELWPYCTDPARRWGPGVVEITLDPDYGFSYQK